MRHIYIVALAAIMTMCFSCTEKERNIIPLPPLEEPESVGEIAVVDQSDHSINIVDRTTGDIIWRWIPSESELTDEQQKWFELPDEVKPIYNCEYLLITATRGGVAIIRIEDKKVVFYACPKGQPHSAEVLPDGNVVVASSSDGTIYADKLSLYKIDPENPLVETPAFTTENKYGHNAVWDRENQLLWSTADTELRTYSYKVEDGQPMLIHRDTYPLPEGHNGAHELFPIHGLKQMWLSTPSGVYKFVLSTKEYHVYESYQSQNIKSISSGPAGYETIMLSPTESYWSDRLIDTAGRIVWQKQGAKIYKGRWMLNNIFSYPDNHESPYTKPQE